jgi:signal transduction histidine kinase
MKRKSIRTQLILIVSVLAIALIVGISYWNFVASRGTILDERKAELLSTAVRASAQLDRDMYEKIKALERIAFSPIVVRTAEQGRLRAMDAGLIGLSIKEIEKRLSKLRRLEVNPQAERFMRTLMAKDENFAEMFFTERNGINVATTNRTSDAVQRDEKWWLAALRKGFSVGDVQYDESARIYAYPVAVVIPHPETGQPNGVLKCLYNFRDIQDIIHQEVLSGESYFMTLSEDYRIISHPDKSLLHQNMEVAGLRTALAGKGRGYFEAMFENLRTGRMEKSLVCFARSKGYKSFRGLGWTVLSVTPLRQIYAPILRERNRTLGVGFLAVLMISGIVFVVMTKVTRPIEQLETMATAIGRGDMEDRIELPVKNEIGRLAAAFNRMIERLQEWRKTVREQNEELQRKNEDLEHKNRQIVEVNQQMQDFVYIVSHDIRAPLVNIQGFSKRLEGVYRRTTETLKDWSLKAEIEALNGDIGKLVAEMERKVPQAFDFVFKSVKKMDDMTEQLLQFSRIETKAARKEWVNLSEMLEDIVGAMAFQAQEKGIRIVIGDLPTIYGEKSRINQVFSNLLFNAIHYMEEENPEPLIEVGVQDDGRRHTFFVKDNGIGIEEEDQEKIFRMFARVGDRAAEGHGMGLAFVKKIVQKHGGRIWVKSEKGEGATFWFTIEQPAKEQEKVEVEKG